MINKVILIGLATILLLVMIQPYFLKVVTEKFEDAVNMCPTNLKSAQLQLDATSKDLLSCKNDKVTIQLDLNEKLNSCLNDKIIQQQRLDSKMQEVSNSKEDIVTEKQRYVDLQRLYEQEKAEKMSVLDRLGKINQETALFTEKVIQIQGQLDRCNNRISNINSKSTSLESGNTEMLELNRKLIKDYDDLSRKYNVYCYDYNISLKKKEPKSDPKLPSPTPTPTPTTSSQAPPTPVSTSNSVQSDQQPSEFGSASGVSATDMATESNSI